MKKSGRFTWAIVDGESRMLLTFLRNDKLLKIEQKRVTRCSSIESVRKDRDICEERPQGTSRQFQGGIMRKRSVLWPVSACLLPLHDMALLRSTCPTPNRSLPNPLHCKLTETCFVVDKEGRESGGERFGRLVNGMSRCLT